MPRNNRTNTRMQDVYQPVGEDEFGRIPPQAIELEEAILGALMLEKDAYSRISDILKPDCFYLDKHIKIFKGIQELAVAQLPVDMHTVSEQLLHDGVLDEIGGKYYIGQLTTKVASAAHLEYHARIVAQKHIARELIRITGEISAEAYEERDDVDELLQRAEGSLFEISQKSQKRDVTQIDPVIEEAIERIKEAQDKEGASGLSTGFHDVDKVTSGWQRSDLVIIAARPAMGKTAFVLSMIKNMAVDFKQPVAMFSLEMANVQLVNRLIMNVCELEGEQIKNGNMNNEDWNKFDHKIRALMGAPIYVDDTPSLSVFELRSKARRLVREHGVQCIVIDYLQLMNASGMNFGSREQEVSMISRSLKGLAKELDIPIIALSQLNRGVEGRNGVEGKRPQLSDLRESGAIEQDADMVCFIHRPEYYHIDIDAEGNSTHGMAEFVIAKHRNGATDIIKMKFTGKYAKFSDYEGPNQLEYAPVTDKNPGQNGDIRIQSGMNNNATYSPDTMPMAATEVVPF